MPTYKNHNPKDVVVGDFIAKGNSTFTLSRYLSKAELNKYIEFISDDPPVSPILYSFKEDNLVDQFTIELPIEKMSSMYRLNVVIECESNLRLYFNSINSTPAYLKAGRYVFNNIQSNLLRKLIIVNDNGSTNKISGYISYC